MLYIYIYRVVNRKFSLDEQVILSSPRQCGCACTCTDVAHIYVEPPAV